MKAIQLTELNIDHVYADQELTREDLNLLLELIQPGISYFFVCDFDNPTATWILVDADTFLETFEFVGPRYVTKFQNCRRKVDG